MKQTVFSLILSLFSLLQCTTVYASTNKSIQSLLLTLDKTIKEKPLYSSKKSHRIDSLTHQLNGTYDLESRYQVLHQLFKEYRSYKLDSALWAAEGKKAVAEAMQNTAYQYVSSMNIAQIVGMAGMHKEAFDIINQTDEKQLTPHQKPYFYHAIHSLYILMYENSFTEKDKQFYEEAIFQYKDSILKSNDPESLGYHLVRNRILIKQQKIDEALDIMLQCYYDEKNKGVTGIIAYELSEIYRIMNDTMNQKKYLAISAIADLQAGVKEYIALQDLSILLYQDGDIERAYTYIKCAMEDASLCMARFRTLEISAMLPIINAAYDKKVEADRKKLLKYFVLTSVLLLILAISLVYIWKQFKKLALAKKSIKTMYEDIKLMNEEMRGMNENLNELNKKLSESNRVKEEYIGSVFNLCSAYINKMESYRISVNRKLKSGQIEEAIKLTSSGTLVTNEQKELFRNFDAIFLNIYPHFIEEFNALLIDKEQIVSKTDHILPPELRIFALIRLGISDSSKIASFLHYSPQTVYNYKLKVHNKLNVSKEDFNQIIQRIGG